MGNIVDTFNSAFRDFAADGVGSSGPHEVVKAEVRAIGPIIEQAISNAALGSLVSVIYATKAELDADLAHAADTIALVYGDAADANNDLYVKVGASGSGSWTNTGALHSIVEGLAQPYLDDLDATVAAAVVPVFSEQDWEAPSSLRNEDIASPASGLTTDEDGISIANTGRFYAVPTLAAHGLAVGDTIKIAYRLLSGSAAPTAITFRNGTTLVDTVNFALIGGWYVLEAVIPATTTIIRIDWTNGSGSSAKITRPRIAKKSTAQRDLTLPSRARIDGIATDPGELANLWTGATSVVITAGTGTATINADGSVVVPGGGLAQISPNVMASPVAVGEPFTALFKASSRLIRQVNIRCNGNVTGTVTVAMRPLGDGWWYFSGVVPAITGSTSVSRFYFEVDNRAPVIAAYTAADATASNFMIVRGLNMPAKLLAAAPDTFPDDEIVVTQSSGAMVISQRAGEPGRYTSWGFTRYNTPAYPDRKVGWRLSSHTKATRTGATSFSAGLAITDGGEFETAIKENGKADFMGGAAHGDAVETRAIQVFIDGAKVTPDGATAYRARTVEVIQRQTLFEVGNATDNPTADLITRWFWERGLLRVSWRIEWLRSITLGAGSYLGMYPCLRNSAGQLVTGTLFASPLYEPFDVSASGHGHTNGNYRRFILTGNAGIKIDVEVTRGWIEGTSRAFVEDTSSPDRNKVYFMPWGAGTAAVVSGTSLEWEVTYRISNSG